MFGYVVRRLIGVVIMLLALSLMTFWMFTKAPADPARLMCGKSCTPALVAADRKQLGLDQPFWSQYARFLVAMPCGGLYPNEGPILACPVLDNAQTTQTQVYCSPVSLGYTFRKGECVTTLIVEAFPVTAALAIGGVILWLITGIGIGIFAALRRGRWQDRISMGGALIGYSFPSFFIALLLLYFVVLTWHLLPYPKYVPFSENPAQFFQTFLLPWIAIAILYAAFYARLTRNQMLETLGEDYIRTARAKGLRERTVIYKHALRAGLTPIVTVVGLDFAALLGGAIIIESVFTLPGIGKLALESTLQLDLPIIMATVLLAAFFVILANLVVDILYAAIDPRVRLV